MGFVALLEMVSFVAFSYMSVWAAAQDASMLPLN